MQGCLHHTVLWPISDKQWFTFAALQSRDGKRSNLQWIPVTCSTRISQLIGSCWNKRENTSGTRIYRNNEGNGFQNLFLSDFNPEVVNFSSRPERPIILMDYRFFPEYFITKFCRTVTSAFYLNDAKTFQQQGAKNLVKMGPKHFLRFKPIFMNIFQRNI